MPALIFIAPDGTRTTVAAAIGTSLMDTATGHNVDGILADCGGSCACATCHCYIGEPWLHLLTPVNEMEDAMLEVVKDRQASSRLACQVRITDAMDGMEVTVADNNL